MDIGKFLEKERRKEGRTVGVIILDEERGPLYLVRPSQIALDGKHLWDTFGHYETEVSAWWIVSVCQDVGGWLPMTLQQIQEKYEKSGHKEPFAFHFLVSGGFIVLGADKRYRVTDEFVDRCFKASPKA